VEGHTATIQLAAPTERYLQPKVAQSEHFITAAVHVATTFTDGTARYETRAAYSVAAGKRGSNKLPAASVRGVHKELQLSKLLPLLSPVPMTETRQRANDATQMLATKRCGKRESRRRASRYGGQLGAHCCQRR